MEPALDANPKGLALHGNKYPDEIIKSIKNNQND
jgi:hypothetical protein